MITILQNSQAASQAAAPKKKDDQPQAQVTDKITISAPGPGTLDQGALEKVLDSKTVSELMGKSLKGGDKVTIKSGDVTVLEIKKESVTALDKFKKTAGDVISAASEEVSNVIQQDPAFAFKESAFAVKDQVFKGVPAGIQTLAESSFLPMIRVVALILDGKKAWDTFKTKRDSSHAEKFIDGGHIVTDVVGLGGAVAMAFPGAGTVATALTVVGVLGDIAAYGYHVTKYFVDRGQPVPDPGPSPDPNPNPTPDPNPTPTPNPSPTPDPNPAPAPAPAPSPAPAPAPPPSAKVP